ALPLTANEAAVAVRVPLKQVHRIIDAGLLQGAVQRRGRAGVVPRSALTALKLAYVTANVLTPAARRKAVQSLLRQPGGPALQDQAVTIDVGGLKAEVQAKRPAPWRRPIQ